MKKILSSWLMFSMLLPALVGVLPSIASATPTFGPGCVANPDQTYVSAVGDDVDGGSAVATSFEHDSWVPSASVGSGADWIWHEASVSNPESDDVAVFIKNIPFDTDVIAQGGDLLIASDNGYKIELNGSTIVDRLSEETTYTSLTPHNLVFNGNDNELKITVKNKALAGGTSETNPAGLIYKLVVHSETCTATVHATKVVCDTEADLPNWGNGAGPDITSTTATDYVANSQGNCHIEPNWEFQKVQNEASDTNPGDNIESAGAPWVTFTGSTTITADKLAWVREKLPSGYIPFSGIVNPNPNDTAATNSAEMHCATAHEGYDNYDFINAVGAENYYCVAFNVLTTSTPPPVENSCPAPDALGDETSETIGTSDEKTLQQILTDAPYSLNATTDQKQYQVWNVGVGSNMNVAVDYIDGISAHPSVFGYYTSGSIATFVPLFKTTTIPTHPEYDSLPTAPAAVPSFNVGGAATVGFAIKSFNPSGTQVGVFATENSVSDGTADQAVVYNPSSNKYVIAFEDLTNGDFDYQDLVVEVTLSCSPVDQNPEDVTVTIEKFVQTDSVPVHASAGNTGSASFNMTATWDTGSGPTNDNFDLGPVGFNNPNPYEATTSDMPNGSDYGVVENGVLPMGTECSANNQNQWVLLGYKVGNSEADALAQVSYSSSASLTNITSDKTILVFNKKCGEVLGETVDLIVKKVIVGDENASPEDFDFTVEKQGNGGPVQYAFEADGQNDLSDLSNGAYDVVEVSAPGYTTTYSSNRPGDNANDCDNIPVSGDNTYTCTVTNTKIVETPKGTINVCKVILDAQGNVVDGAGSGATFTIPFLTIPADPNDTEGPSAGDPADAVFDTALTLNTHVNIGGEANNAECVSYQVDPGRYYYGEESISPSSSTWETPLYDDQVSAPIDNISDLLPFNSDLNANDDADGVINVAADQTRTLVVLNKMKPEARACDAEVNLLTNGSFENPEVTNGAKWDIFPSGTATLAWLAAWINSVGAPEIANVEIQENGLASGWAASDGDQWAELDSDWGGPSSGQSGEAGSVAISQTLTTVNGQEYNVSFDFSARPNTGLSENGLEVLADGNVIGTVPATAGGAATSWTPYSFSFVADNDGSTVVTFRELATNPNNSVGTFVDNVKVNCEEDEESEDTGELVVIKETVGGDGTFHFNLTGTAGFDLTTNEGNGHSDSETIEIDADTNYDITENAVPGWNTSVSCVYENESVGSPIAGGKTINVEAGETVTCTFVNTKVNDSCDATDVESFVVSDTTNSVVGPDSSGNAIATFVHAAWASAAALGNGATWIWDAANVSAPTTEQTSVFTKTFEVDGAVLSADFAIATDNGFILKVNGTTVDDKIADEFNYGTVVHYDVASLLHGGTNTIEVTVKNFAVPNSNSESNPAGLLYKLTVHENDCEDPLPPPPPPACSDGISNDQDGLVDAADPGCHSDGDVNNADSYVPTDNDESNTTAECGDGIDNGDDDQLVDSNDPECLSGPDGAYDPNDTSEDGTSDTNQSSNDDDGGIISSGSRASFRSAGSVLGAETSCGIYVDKFLRKGYKNNPDAVKAVQQFLNNFTGAHLVVDGIFGAQTEAALKAFQLAHKDKILDPWGITEPTGIFYLTTQTEVNNIMCPDLDLEIPEVLIPFSNNPGAPAPAAQ